MLQTSIAQAKPVLLHVEQKLPTTLADLPVNYSHVAEFSPEAVRKQLKNIVNEILGEITQRCTVSVNTDNVGVRLNVIAPEFSFELIYTEGETQA